MTRAVVLCADDYALSPGISRGILQLAEQGRLSAISCMTGALHWPDHAQWLRPLIGKVDIGLHVTLVDEAPLTPMPHTAPNGKLPSIGALILRAYLGQVRLAEIEREVSAQFEAFEAALGRAPDHVDGHLHTHVLPGIRDVVLRLAQAHAPNAWVRNVAEPWPRIVQRGISVPKTLLISALGRGLDAPRMNDGFSGVYGLRGDEDLPAYVERFFGSTSKKHVVLCHPGDCVAEDVPIGAARTKEFSYLASDAFAEMLQRADVRLARFASV
jgi:chitin disaccharide deacetylase